MKIYVLVVNASWPLTTGVGCCLEVVSVSSRNPLASSRLRVTAYSLVPRPPPFFYSVFIIHGNGSGSGMTSGGHEMDELVDGYAPPPLTSTRRHSCDRCSQALFFALFRFHALYWTKTKEEKTGEACEWGKVNPLRARLVVTWAIPCVSTYVSIMHVSITIVSQKRAQYQIFTHPP